MANADPTCKHFVMVGFGRDGDVHSVGKYRPNMTILQVATNKDLQLPWLKADKTDSAFTIISEPEVRLHEQTDGKVRLEVVGLNAFNPNTGVVEPPSARQIMGIMVDTEYDTQSFRARLMNVKQVKRNQKTIKPKGSPTAEHRRREVGADAFHYDHPIPVTPTGDQDSRQGHRPDRHGAHDGDRLTKTDSRKSYIANQFPQITVPKKTSKKWTYRWAPRAKSSK